MQGPSARFDRYEVLAPLGAGGMGEVVKARAQGPHGFEKIVAIKRIRAEWSEQEAMAERFIREARIAARLQHANIVQVFDFGRHGDELFIVMEYVDGQSLDAILAALRAQGKRPTLAQCLQLGLDVSRALDSAHNLVDEEGAPDGIVHRDVSPANVLVSRQGLVKLTDFGIAAWASQQGRTSLIAGKPLYMAPEQLRGDALDARADLFAVGILLYELVSGERPWKGPVDASTDATLAGMGYQSPSQRTPDAPADMDALIERLLAPDRRERMSSARELTKEILALSYRTQVVLDPSELRPLVGDAPSEAHAPTLPQYASKAHTLIATGVSPDGVTVLKTEDDPVAPSPSMDPPARGAPSWVWAALAAVVLASGVGMAWAVTGGDSAREPASFAAEPPPRDPRRVVASVAVDPPEVEAGTVEVSATEPELGHVTSEDVTSEDVIGEADTGESDTSEPAPSRPVRAGRPPSRAPRHERTGDPTPRAAAGSGELDVFSRPWAQIWIDGVRQPQNAPARGLRVSAGTHQIRLVNPVSGLSAERTVVVADGGRAQVRVFLDQPSE